MLLLSICLISKNEEKHIEHCLKALSPFTDAGAELVLTDTGSTDRTKEIARHFTDRIFDFKWCDDFSAAKNHCASKAANDWILFLDCDEYFDSNAPDKALSSLADFIQNTPTQYAGQILLKSRTASGSMAVDRLARVYNKTYYAFKGIIHEQLFPLNQNKPLYRETGLHFDHSGYTDASILQQKATRNLNLLLKELQQHPSDTYTLFQIGQAYRSLNMPDKALPYFEKALSCDIDPRLDYVQTMVESYGYTLLDLKQSQKALELLGVYDTFSIRADFVFLMGIIYMNNGMFEEAISQFEQAVTIPNHSIEGVNSYSAYYNIGVICECTGQKERALASYRKCGDYSPALNRIQALTQA